MLDKHTKIRNSLIETKSRRKDQVCKVVKVKIQQNRLTALQKEQLKMIFVEAKWFVNSVLNWTDIEKRKLEILEHLRKF